MGCCAGTCSSDDVEDLVTIHVTSSYSYTARKVRIECKKTQKLLTCETVKHFHMAARMALSCSNDHVCMPIIVNVPCSHKNTAGKTLKGKETLNLSTT